MSSGTRSLALDPRAADGAGDGAAESTRTGSVDGVRFVLAFQLLLLLGIGLPLLLRPADTAPDGALGAALAWGICVVSTVRLALLALDGSMRMLSLSFWAFVYVWLGAAPLAQFSHGYFPHRGTYTRDEVVTTFAMIALGLVCYEVGKRLPSAGRAPALLASVASRVVCDRKVPLFGLAALVVSTVLAYFLGSSDIFFASRTQAHEALQNAVGEQHSDRLHLAGRALQVPPFIALYLATWLLMARRRAMPAARRHSMIVLAAALVVLNLLVSNPFNSPRYWLGTMALSLGLALLPWSARWSYVLWAGLLTTALLVVFPYTDLFRDRIDFNLFHFRGLEPVASKSDYDAFQQILNTVPFVQENGLSLGRQAAGSLLFWIPRVWWTGKPVQSGEMVAEFANYTHVNLSMPLWGEAFLDGGLLAVAAVFLLYGRISESLERAYLSGWRQGTLFQLLLPMLAGYQIFLLRGALMSAVAYFTPMLLGLYIATRPGPGVVETRASEQTDVPRIRA